jgi:cellulose biosynthesis protein BcsQ
MGKPIVVIADTDTNYLGPLELKFAEELYKRIDLEIISDAAYFQEYFSVPSEIALLIVSEQLYSEMLHRHDIKQLFVLAEDPKNGGESEGDGVSYKNIFKYSSTNEIFNEIMYAAANNLQQSDLSEKESQVLLFYSASGGAGKTTAALGTAACLSANHKKTIYIDAEYIHTFQRYLTDKSFVSNNVYSEFRADNAQIFDNIRHYVRSEKFDYIPPFCVSLSSLNINFAVYKVLIDAIKKTKEYDYILVDIDSALSAEKIDLFSAADRVVILLNQDHYSIFKTDILMNSISVSDKEKNIFVCNKYRSDSENAILSESSAERFIVSEYIEHIDDMDSITIGGLANIKGFQKLAFLLI